jgi:putative membrane protein
METTLAVHHAGWGWGWIFPVAWIVLIGFVWIFVWRGPWSRRRTEALHDAGSPQATLGERYALGEIDEEEYRKRLAVLRERG